MSPAILPGTAAVFALLLAGTCSTISLDALLPEDKSMASLSSVDIALCSAVAIDSSFSDCFDFFFSRRLWDFEYGETGMLLS